MKANESSEKTGQMPVEAIKIQTTKELKDQLDEIDDRVIAQVFESFYQSKLIILMGMWEKGKVVAGEFRGVDSPLSYRELEHQTGRDHKSLKTWHDLYNKYLQKEKYLPVAEKKAKEWAEKALNKSKGLAVVIDTPPFPKGKFKVIYADPPWKYSDELIENYGAAVHHYPLMTIDEISRLGDKEDKPVKDIIEDNAVLFLWVTSPLLDECWPVIEKWGFDYKASFVWDKVKHNYGHYNSARHEFLLVCTKGSCLPEKKELQDSVISYERTETHSQKPEYFRVEIIDKLYPSGKAIELFFRGDTSNLPKRWDAWGMETKSVN